MEQNILIVGCGVAGASLASFLALGGGRYRITIVDRVPNLQPHGQNVDIRNEGIQSLRKLGIENQVLESTTGEIGVRHVDENNEIWAEVPVIHDAAVHSPTSEIEILRGRLASICWERSKELGSCLQKSGNGEIEYLFGESISNIEQEPDAVRVTFQSSKETRKFHFVVGADGLRSQTRRLIWGKQKEIDFVKSIGAYGAFFSIPSSTTDSQWRRWCLTPGRKSIMLRPDGTGARTTVLMTIIKQPDLGLEVLAENHAEATPTKKKLLASLFASTGWEAPRILTGMNETNDFYCDEIAQVKMPTWFKGRVFLLGDAAWCSSPMSGLGTTLALVGAEELAKALQAHSDEPEVMGCAYEAAMKPMVEEAQKLPPGGPAIMHPATSWGIHFLHLLMLCATKVIPIIIWLIKLFKRSK